MAIGAVGTRVTMLLQLLGFAALAACMHATPHPLRLRDASRSRRLARIGGAMLLILSMVMAAMRRPVGLAILDWCGLATLSAGLMLLILAFVRARTARR